MRAEKDKIMDKKVTSDVKIADAETIKNTPKKQKTGFLRWLIVLIVVIAIILLGLFVISKVTSWNVLGINKNGVGDYQAVFLDNGQVYFGQVKNQNSDTVIVKDIYYLQVTKPLQPADNNAKQQNEVSLVKLGNELHGPEDEMKINRTHILFIENLKAEGKVVTAIKKHKESLSS